MPDLMRQSLRMDCSGIDLVHPIDRMPPGSFAYLFNVRVLVEGRIDGRPGYTEKISIADSPNSIRRLNDPSRLYASAGYTYVGGGGANLYAGTEPFYAIIDSGYSGDPLSLITFRPDQAPESWMYVYDRAKQSKVRPDGTVRAIGVTPPTRAPVIEYGVPGSVDIENGQSPVGGWFLGGAATGVFSQDRTNGAAATITTIKYNTGNTGWCCINPSITDPSWTGARMKVMLNQGTGNQEEVLVREVHTPITNSGVAAIHYDVGTTGLCSLVLNGSPIGLQRNSLIRIDSEVVRVLEVILSPDGSTYSLRCNTAAPHVAASPVVGLISWYVYTTQIHNAGETINAAYVSVTQPGAGAGSITENIVVNAGAANNRPIDTANDYLHISMFLADPTVVTTLQMVLSLDVTPNTSFTNPGNSFLFTLTGADLKAQGASANSWVEILVPISSATRTGSDFTRNLSNVSGVGLQLTTTAACNWGFDWWYLFGTFGPTIQPNAPAGYIYQSRFRDSSTGAYSVPGPLTRYDLSPLRESVIITPPTSTQAGVDTIDIYRFGGTIDTTPLYDSSVPNNVGSPQSYTDALTDSALLEVNQPPDLTAIQPWPILGTPISGTVIVDGTSILWSSGDQFNLAMLNNTVILINGTAFLTYGQPRSSTFLEITQDAGNIPNATFQIASPTLAGQSLPFAFGPLEGPFAPVVFALGDPLNGGTLYYANPSAPDSAADTNTLELAPPSSDLVSGAVWNGLAIAGNKDDLFCIRYSYLSNPLFQWAKIPSPSGMWSRWACCTCPLGVAYLGRDGIYIATDSGSVNITDDKLYSLFPHDGQPAEAIGRGDNVILPVNMARLTNLRLTYCDEELRFAYFDTGGNSVTLIYEIYKKRWFLNVYHDNINMHYLIEGAANLPLDQRILQMSLSNNSGTFQFFQSGGNKDGSFDITSLILLPALDNGDERLQKLYVDTMIQADGNGDITYVAAYDNAQPPFSPTMTVTTAGFIEQFIQNISSLANLALYRNLSAKFSWTGGPDGPRLYAWEYSGFAQPYLSKFFVTQYINLSFPGWKHMRRAYPALISNSPILLTIRTQDGRTFGPYTIPSTAGQYRILPFMLDQNLKDLAFAFQLDGQGQTFALFPSDFVIETKEWREETFIQLACFKT